MRKLISSAILMLALGQVVPRPAAVQISLPDWASGGTCVVRHDERVVATITVLNRLLQLPCSPEGASVACDVIGAEPIDTSLAEVCGASQVPFARAKDVAVESAAGDPLRIQWLQIGPDGRAIVLATRPASAGSRVVVPVTPSPLRLVRFSRVSYSPVTVSALDLTASDPWRLPPAVSGAELIVWRATSPVAPETYLLSAGGRESAVPREPSDSTFIRGLTAGLYRLTPVYAGGVKAAAHDLKLEAERSTLLVLPREPVGGAKATLSPTLCAEAGRLRIARQVTESSPLASGGQSTRVVSTPFAVAAATCDATFGGLPEGEYEFAVENRQGSTVLRTPFRIQVDATTDILTGAAARLSGVVTLNGRGLVEAILEFVPQGGSRPTAQGKTDASGHYSVDFQTPGPYSVALRTGGVPVAGQQQQIVVRPGEGTFDWKLTGGSLALTIDNLQRDAGGSVQLDLDQIAPAVTDGRPGFSYRVRSTDPALDERPMYFKGLGFGVYAIRAKQLPERSGPTKTSRRVEFTLSETKPDAKVTLELRENNGRFVLTDSLSRPVQGASIYGRGFNATETEPGIYSMDGVPPGFPMNIRASGYAPACRAAPDGVTVNVAMDQGRPVEIRFPGLDPAASSPVGTIGWTDADCRVALDAFQFVKLPVANDGVPAFVISNFPTTAAVTHSFVAEPPRAFAVIPGQPLIIRR